MHSRIIEQRLPDEKPTVARFACSESPPRLTACLQLAERVHLALVSLSDGAEVFTGCDSSGQPLQGHRHAYILCECNPESGRVGLGEITHITVFARAGFGLREEQALMGLERIWGPDDIDISLTLEGMGCREGFPDSPLLGPSREWVSRTPFLPARHAKVTRAGAPRCDARGYQIGGPEHELLRLLALAGLPEPVALEPVEGTLLGGQVVPWREFTRRRSSGGGKGAVGGGYGFRIRFAEEVAGPVALGYAGHFGMGAFVCGGR